MKKAFQIIFSLLTLTGFFWLFIAFAQSSFEVQAGILSFIGAVCIATYNHVQTKRRETEARHFSEKRAAYLHYINLIFDLLHAKNGNKRPSQEHLIKNMMEFKKNMLVWGSAEVIKAYYQFEHACDPEIEGYDAKQSLLTSERLFRALRKDLGHDDSILGTADLVGLILKPDSRKELENTIGSIPSKRRKEDASNADSI